MSEFHLSLYPQWPHSLTQNRPGLCSEERADSLALRPKVALGRLVRRLPARPCQLNRLGMLCPSDDFLFAHRSHCENKQCRGTAHLKSADKCANELIKWVSLTFGCGRPALALIHLTYEFISLVSFFNSLPPAALARQSAIWRTK